MIRRTKHLPRRHAFVAVAMALVLVGTACGSSSKDTTAGSTATSAPATGTPLKIGWIGSLTTATGVVPNGAHDSIDSWVKYTNAHGGVAGHPVEISYADDKADPAVGLAAVKDLVENKGVIAIVGSNAGATQQTWAPYVLAKKVPVINGDTIDATWFTNPMFYPAASSVVANIWGQMKSAAVAGNTKVGVILCTESPACAQAQPLFKANAEAVGMTEVYAALASQTQASYTAECLSAKNAGAQAVAAFINLVVFVRDCSRQGYTPFYISANLGPTLSTIKQQPELGKTVGSSEQWPCLDQTVPNSSTLFGALKQYHPSWTPGGADYPNATATLCQGWSGGVAFAKAINNAGMTPTATVASADVIRGLSQFKGETLGGVAPPLTFSDGTKPNPQVLCTFLYKWNNQKVEAVKTTDQIYTCKPA
jgi:branched-chain amino acid transport system substrate-binding protein